MTAKSDDEVIWKTLIGHLKLGRDGWVGDSRASARYLALAFGPFPGTPPPLSGFLQSLQVRRLIHLGPGLLNVSCSMSHGCPLSLPPSEENYRSLSKVLSERLPCEQARCPRKQPRALPGDALFKTKSP